MLRGLFKAVDSGDRAGAKACLAQDTPFPVLIWDLDLEAKPVEAKGADGAAKYLDGLLDSIAKTKATVASKITSIHADCHSPELGYATLEYTQTTTVDGKAETSRCRATALCTSDKSHKWRVFHWHASPVPAAVAPADASKGKDSK
jgi:hypothetical protein